MHDWRIGWRIAWGFEGWIRDRVSGRGRGTSDWKVHSSCGIGGRWLDGGLLDDGGLRMVSCSSEGREVGRGTDSFIGVTSILSAPRSDYLFSRRSGRKLTPSSWGQRSFGLEVLRGRESSVTACHSASREGLSTQSGPARSSLVRSGPTSAGGQVRSGPALRPSPALPDRPGPASGDRS